MNLLLRLIPLVIIKCYQLIPRRRFGRGSSSHLAVRHIAGGGNGWAAIWHWAARPLLAWMVMPERGGPSWSDPRDL